MTTTSKNTPTLLQGLGWWNMYFIIKIALFLQGVIDFHPVENFALLLLILFPLRQKAINVTRHIVAVPLAVWLMHYDSYLPPLDRLWAQTGQLLQFETAYLIELLGRFVTYQVMIVLFVLCTAYYILSKFLRVSVLVVATMMYISIPQQQTAQTVVAAPITNQQTGTAAGSKGNMTTTPVEINDSVLNNLKADFFERESARQVNFSADSSNDVPFDLLFLSICSVAWDDIEITGLGDHPLFKEFDIMFDNFSAATSYSGPAVIRLLRASCGQQEQDALFEPAPTQQCYLFDNLKNLGFEENLLLNHNGVFDSFLDLIQKNGNLQANMMPQTGLTPYQKSFDGSTIFRDKQVLNHWWNERLSSNSDKVVALYNTISLHDGNRIISANSSTSMVSYKRRLNNLLDDLYDFFQTLKASKRNIVVALVPEHGAGMRGDRMQISGMREIPAPTIVHTPVGLKIFGEGMERIGGSVAVKAPSSYLSLSQLVANILEQDIYKTKRFSPIALTKGLPETRMVSQNSGSTMMEVNGKYYVTLDESSWSEYPVK